ncbi:MAG: DUF3108 domain-containing protein [Methyloceanibacter sp.]
MGSRRYSVILAALLLMALAPERSSSEAAGPGAGQVVVTYDAALAGLSLGEFQVTASFNGSAYEMAADGSFSLLAGMLYSASGKTTSSGKLTDAAAQPAKFALDYKGGKKRERRRLTFFRGAVSQVTIVPRKKPNPRNIPISTEQLKDVLDPLTAAFLSVRGSGEQEICRQTIPVFDGRQRFDLVLTPKRSESLGDEAPEGLSGPIAVCRVRNQPIGGYRPDNPGVKYMSKNEEIEAWLVRVPRTDLYMPYRILVPTAWGAGAVTLTDIEASVAERQRASAP